MKFRRLWCSQHAHCTGQISSIAAKKFDLHFGVQILDRLDKNGTPKSIACIAGVERGRGEGEKERGRGIGERGLEMPAIRIPFCLVLWTLASENS